MKNFYLPENTKYLTNNGLKCVSEFTEDDEILTISNLGEIEYTKDFNIQVKQVGTMTLKTDGSYQGVMADCDIDFKDYGNYLKNENSSQTKINLDGEIYEIDKALAISISLFVSNFFKPVIKTDKITSLKEFKQKSFKVLSSVNLLTGLYFHYDKFTSNYTFSSSSFYKSPEVLEKILIENISIFDKIILCLKKIHYSTYKGVYFIEFKTYRLANIFSALLTLSGYKSKVVFNKDFKTFTVSYTNAEHQLNFKYNVEKSEHCFEDLTAYSVQFNKTCSIVISQNINKLTTTSIVKASYNLLTYNEGDEDGFE